LNSHRFTLLFITGTCIISFLVNNGYDTSATKWDNTTLLATFKLCRALCYQVDTNVHLVVNSCSSRSQDACSLVEWVPPTNGNTFGECRRQFDIVHQSCPGGLPRRFSSSQTERTVIQCLQCGNLTNDLLLQSITFVCFLQTMRVTARVRQIRPHSRRRC
jgi:hypothetical protein